MVSDTPQTDLSSPEFNIFKALDWIRDNAKPFAQARANKIYMEEFRKTKKSLLMQDAERRGIKTFAAQERDAYAHPDYIKHLEVMRDAIELEEHYRWKFVAAQAKIEAWRTISANARAESQQFPTR